jgi:hypothetical protein
VRLTKKFANMIDDVDLRRFSVGQTINVSQRDGRLLVKEGWAVPNDLRSQAADRPKRESRPKRGR